MNLAVPADHRVEMKVSKKVDKYLDLTREPRKMSNKMVILIPIVVVVLGTVPKSLDRGQEQL